MTRSGTVEWGGHSGTYTFDGEFVRLSSTLGRYKGKPLATLPIEDTARALLRELIAKQKI